MADIQRDIRRYGVIDVHRINAATYHLIIGDEMWSEVEWSETRQAWCIQDVAGHCLLHVDHIVGQDADPAEAIRIAKRMIVDGRMPAPEEALRQLHERQQREDLGEPMPLIAERDGELIDAPTATRLDPKPR